MDEENKEEGPIRAARRGPGKSKIIRTRNRGRPNKQYHPPITREAENKDLKEANIAVISMKEAISVPEAAKIADHSKDRSIISN